MRSLSRSLLSRGLLLALVAAPLVTASLVHTSQAVAQSTPFAAPGFVELLAPSQLEGNGEKVTLAVLALNPDGTPMEDLKAKVGATEGGTTELIAKGGGLYEFSWTTPQTTKPSDVSFTLKGKNGAREAVSRSWTLTVSPNLPVQMQVSSSPSELILGQDESSSLNVKLVGPGGQAVGDGADLLVSSSYGTVEAVTYLGNGAFTARYVPKKVNYPHLDILTFADARDPSRVYGVHVVQMTGKTDFPVRGATPNSTVILKIGDRDFGPYNTDTQGNAVVPITVPPGVPTGTRVTITNGQQTEEDFDLQLPPTPRLAIFPLNTVPGDGTGAVEIRVAVRTPLGEADPDAKVNLTVSSGSVTQPVHEGNGIYRATYTASRQNAATQATITASLAGEAGKDEQLVNIAPVRPSNVTLSAEPSQLSSGSTSFKVFTKITGADGLGIDGQQLSFVAAGARTGATKDLRNGDYQTSFNTTSGDSVQLSAVALGPVSGNPLAQVVLLPANERLTNDGSSATLMTVLTVDQYGYPVANQTVNLRIAGGDGAVPATVVTDEGGIASVYLSAGRQPGVISVDGRVGDLHGRATVLSLPADVAPGLALPALGSDAAKAADARFEGVVTSVIVPREGASGVAVAAVTTAEGPVGALATLGVTAQPPEVAPGGSVTVTINAKDDSGRGVPGLGLKLLASNGSVGPLIDRGGGTYETTLSANNGAVGDVMLVVTSADGSVSSALPVAITGSTWGNTGAPPETTDTTTDTTSVVDTTTTTTVVEEPEVVKEPRERKPAPSGFTNGRLRASFVGGTYAYSQTKMSSNTVLWDDNIDLGMDAGSPAAPIGFDVDGYYWLPFLPYVGVEAQARVVFYSVPWPGTDASVPDQVPHIGALAMARYPFQAGNAQFHVGAKAGYVYGDFITYQKGETDTTLDYNSVAIHAFGAGGEIGAEFGRRAFLKAEYLTALRGKPYSHSAMFEAGVRPMLGVPVSVVGNFAISNRTIDIVARDAATGEIQETIGVLQDTSLLFGGGIAMEF
jgi:hypothetical protein